MPRVYTLRHQCIDCGAPTGRPGSRCPACRAVAKSAWNKAYQWRYHATHRPSPAPRSQPRPDLPPAGTLVYDDDGGRVQCHVCGRFYRSLVIHVRTHGLDAARYKKRFDLARGASLLSPATTAKQRAAALARDQGAIGRANLPEGSSRPKGIGNRLQSRVRSSTRSARHATVADRLDAQLRAYAATPRKAGARVWTLDELRAVCDPSRTAGDVARTLGGSASHVRAEIQRLRKAGIPVPRTNPQVRRRRPRTLAMVADLKAGMSTEEVARTYGVSRQRVSQVRRAYDIATPRRALGPSERTRAIIADLHMGMLHREIAKKHGVGTSAVSLTAKRYGIQRYHRRHPARDPDR